MISGVVQIDPVTGQPLEVLRDEQRRQASQEEAKALKEQAAFADITSTPEGQQVVGIVQRKLDARIDELVENDPTATAYLTLLKELGIREGQGRRAALAILERYLKKKTA